MREILFRAKGKDGEGWKEGYYWRTRDTTYCFTEDYDRHPNNTKHYLIFDQMTDWGLPNRKLKMDIDPETLCQYTGMIDSKGTRIFEGDIVECVYDGTVYRYVVVYDLDELDFKATNGKEKYGKNFEYLPCCEEVVVIGNIYDNLELLNGGERK